MDSIASLTAAARAEIDQCRRWAIDAGQPFTLESCVTAVTQHMDDREAGAWYAAIAAAWTDADEVTAT
jgi:hypothetical protein